MEHCTAGARCFVGNSLVLDDLTELTERIGWLEVDNQLTLPGYAYFARITTFLINLQPSNLLA